MLQLCENVGTGDSSWCSDVKYPMMYQSLNVALYLFKGYLQSPFCLFNKCLIKGHVSESNMRTEEAF